MAAKKQNRAIAFGTVEVQRTCSDQHCRAIKARFLLLSWHSSVHAGALHLSFNANAIARKGRVAAETARFSQAQGVEQGMSRGNAPACRASTSASSGPLPGRLPAYCKPKADHLHRCCVPQAAFMDG
jgi:hypothetical protein